VIPTGAVSFTRDGNPLGSAPLQPDGTATFATSALPAGTDNITATYAGDVNYAGSTSTAVVETISPPPPGNSTPTLAPTITASTLPQALISGAAAHGTVKVRVTNSSGADIKGKSTVTVFATTTGTIDGSAVLLGQSAKSMAIKAGRSVTTSIPIRLGTGRLAAGTYTLVARVTDPSGNTNDSPAAQTLTVAAPFISLSEVSTKSTLPASATSGGRLRAAVTLAITNQGNVSTSGSTTIDLFATTDGTIDNGAVQLASVVARVRIKPGKSARVTVRVSSLPTLAAGTYLVIAQVTDPNGQTTSAPVGSITIS